MFSFGTHVTSSYDKKIAGPIVGYGTICWPTSANIGGDGGIPRAVYLIQVADGSSSLGPACRVIRADHAVETEKV